MEFKYFANDIFEDKTGNLPVQFAQAAVDSGAEATLVTGAATKITRIISATFFTPVLNLEAYIRSTTGTAKLGPIYLGSYATFVLPFNPYGWFESKVGEDLIAGCTDPSVFPRNVSIRYIQYTR